MAIALVLPPEETRNDVTVLGYDGQPAQEFVAVWRTPSDAERDDIQVARARVSDAAARLGKGDAGSVSTAEGLLDMVRDYKRAVTNQVRNHLLRVDLPEFEESDIDAMLQHDNYRVALFGSLLAVADGSAARKNALSPDTSGKPESSPATTDQF